MNTAADRGMEFLNKHIITDDVLKDYIEEDEVKKLRPVEDYQEQLRKSFLGTEEELGDKMPWSKASHFRFRKHELTIWTGYNGHKKSMVLGQVCLGFRSQGKKICIASPEMHPVKTLKRMCRQYVGVAEPTKPYQDKFFEWMKDHFWIYDQSGTLKPKNILGVIRYSKEKLNVDHFVIDSLMKCGINEDDLNRQKWFVDELTTIAKDTGIHIHLVAHQRKSMTDEAKKGSKYGVAGSANITNLADNVLNVYENQKEEGYDNSITPEKQRNYEGEGNPHQGMSFWFDQKSLQFKEYEKQPPMNDQDWDCPSWL